MALSEKLEIFALAIARGKTKSDAYRLMVPRTKAKDSSIWAKASKLSKLPEIEERIKELRQQIKELAEKEFNISQGRVLMEIARLAFNDPREAFNENGNLKPIKDWPDEVAAAISSIKITEQVGSDDVVIQLKEIKFWDKGKQIELAAKTLGMLNDKLDINLTVDPIQELMEEIEGSVLRPKLNDNGD